MGAVKTVPGGCNSPMQRAPRTHPNPPPKHSVERPPARPPKHPLLAPERVFVTESLPTASQPSYLCPNSPFLLLAGSWHPSQTPSIAILFPGGVRGIFRKAVLPVCGEALPDWIQGPKEKEAPDRPCKAKPTTGSPGQEGKGTNTSPAGTPWPTDYLFPHTCWTPA